MSVIYDTWYVLISKIDMIQYPYFYYKKTNQDMSSPSQSPLPSSFGTRMLELRNNDETSNVGTKWTIEEDTKLVQEITENKTYE